ncbi:hypothetical protein ACC846_38875, partial [Rhizobium ruizarguesonis]
IRSAANLMENELKVLSENGREVATKISLLIGKLDFQHDLGIEEDQQKAAIEAANKLRRR